MWAIVDPDRPRDGYTEVVAWGTGWPLPEDVYLECDYWGTCEDGCGFVWHYFAAARFPDREYEDNGASDSTYYPLNSITTVPYSLSDVTISGDALNSREWSFSLSQETIDQLTKYIEGSCNTATNKCVQ